MNEILAIAQKFTLSPFATKHMHAVLCDMITFTKPIPGLAGGVYSRRAFKGGVTFTFYQLPNGERYYCVDRNQPWLDIYEHVVVHDFSEAVTLFGYYLIHLIHKEPAYCPDCPPRN